MRRKLTKPVGHWKVGHVFDQPRSWWEAWFPGYQKFSVETDTVEPEAPRRGRPPKGSVSDVARSHA